MCSICSHQRPILHTVVTHHTGHRPAVQEGLQQLARILPSHQEAAAVKEHQEALRSPFAPPCPSYIDCHPTVPPLPPQEPNTDIGLWQHVLHNNLPIEMQRAAMTDAARCNGRCNALRLAMHRRALFRGKCCRRPQSVLQPTTHPPGGLPATLEEAKRYALRKLFPNFAARKEEA